MPELGMSVSSLGSRTRDSTTRKWFASDSCFSKWVVCLRVKKLVVFFTGNGFLMNVAYYFIFFCIFHNKK
jgi:hypothetical protein